MCGWWLVSSLLVRTGWVVFLLHSVPPIGSSQIFVFAGTHFFVRKLENFAIFFIHSLRWRTGFSFEKRGPGYFFAQIAKKMNPFLTLPLSGERTSKIPLIRGKLGVVLPQIHCPGTYLLSPRGTIIGTSGLNCSVRNGKRCDSAVKVPEHYIRRTFL